MDGEAKGRFDKIIAIAQDTFENVEIECDISYQRAILKIEATFKEYKVRITEIIDQDRRKYSYYLIRGGNVTVGFDNAPDGRALKLKYRGKSKEHLGEYIPHAHGEKKRTIRLTKEIFFEDFLDEIKLF